MNDAVMQDFTEALRLVEGDRCAAAQLALASALRDCQPATAPREAALTVTEAAERLRVSQDTVYTLVAKGELPHHRIGRGRSIRFSPDDLSEYQRRRAAAVRRPLTPRRADRL